MLGFKVQSSSVFLQYITCDIDKTSI